MRQPSLAAQRFYQAFYRWNLFLTTTTTSSSHVPSHRRLSTTSTLHARDEGRGHSSQHTKDNYRTHPSHGVKRLQFSPINGASPQTSSSTPQGWLTVAPMTSAQKPFDMLGIWEDVVRYRSSAGIMVQTAVPVERIEELEEVYGKDLNGMSETLFGKEAGIGARVEVGGNAVEKERKDSDADGERRTARVLSVLYSGTFEEVGKVWKELRGKSQHESALMQKKGKNAGVVRAFYARSDQWNSTDHEAQLVLHPLKPSLETGSPLSPLAWHEKPPVSRSVRPTNSLTPFKFIIRKRSTAYSSSASETQKTHHPADPSSSSSSALPTILTVETIIPASTWPSGLYDEYVAQAALRAGTKLLVSETFIRTIEDRGKELKSGVRSVEIEGTVEAVQEVREAVIALRGRLHQVLRAKGIRGKGGQDGNASFGPESKAAESHSELSAEKHPPPARSSPPSSSPGENYTPIPFWLLSPPQSASELPVAEMRPFRPVLRARQHQQPPLATPDSNSALSFHVEIVVPATPQWDHELMLLMQRWKGILKLSGGRSFEHVNGGSGERLWRRAVEIGGKGEQVRAAVKELEGLRERIKGVDGSVGDGESLVRGIGGRMRDEEKKVAVVVSPREQKAERGNVGFKAYCTVTLPIKAKSYVNSMRGFLRLRTGCLLRNAEEFDGVDEDGVEVYGVTVWGRNERLVGTGVVIMRGFLADVRGHGVHQGGELRIVEKGMSDVPMPRDVGAMGNGEEGADVGEVDVNADVVDNDVETVFGDERSAAFPDASATAYGKEEEEISADISNAARFENDVLLPESSFKPLEEGVEATEDSAESRDDLIFPEFRPPFENELPTNQKEPFTENAALLNAIAGKSESMIQQRAYSTTRTTDGSESTAMAVSDNSKATIDVEEVEEDASFSPTTEQLAEDLKRALRALTHPVVLVTSRLPKDPDTPDSRLEICRGVTISSFTTVTLFPKPIISFNLRVPSRSWDAILSSERLAVHILAANARGAAVAHPFTQASEVPSEPFKRLERLGVYALVNMKDKLRAPKLSWDDGILARLQARLQTSKCVHVGDHVIVVAEVSAISFPPGSKVETDGGVANSVGLSYAMRGYRGVGEAIEPVEVPALEDAEKGQSGPSSNHAEGRITVKAPGPAHDAGNQRSRIADAGNGAVDGLQAKALNEERISVDREEEDHSHFDGLIAQEGHEFESARLAEDAESFMTIEDYFEQAEKTQFEENPARASSTADFNSSQGHASTLDTRRNGPKRGSQHPWGVATSSRSSYSTLARQGYRDFTTRSYTTSSASLGEDSETQNNTISMHPKVSDPGILTSTVADFLDIPDDNFVPPPRIRGLMRAQKEAQQASRRLERALADGSLTAEESARLEHVVTRNERRIAKTLALRSAKELCRMLDKGRVEFRRAQWLESSIEKGQAVLLDEARQLRRLLDDRTIDAERFRKVKEMLEQQNQVLTAEATRLRQMVDEEGEGGPVQEEERKFDGFRGNI